MAAELPLLDGVHGLDAGDQLGGCVESTETQHRPRSPLDRSVVLLDQVVEVLGLAQLDVQAGLGLQALDGGGVGAALVDGHLLRGVVDVDRLGEKPAGAASSRLAVSRKSTVWPSRSTARYKYLHSPPTRT